MACLARTQSMPGLIAEISRQTESDLRKILPPANKNTPRAERLKITGERPAGENFVEIRVTAVGDFNPASARDFATVARKQRHPIIQVITVTLYSDATHPRTLVAAYGENRSGLIQRMLREKLPPPAPSETGLPFSLKVSPLVEGIVDAYHVTASGPFTKESAASFVGAIHSVQKSLAGETRLYGVVTSNASRPITLLETFNTAAGTIQRTPSP
jgi:hypothetical protein